MTKRVELTKCRLCGHTQHTVKPWKHIPKCKNCRKPMQ